MSDLTIDDAQRDRDANDCIRGVSAASFMSTAIFFAIMQALRFAHDSFGLEYVFIYIVSVLYFILTVAFFAYGLSENFALVYRFVLLRRKIVGEVTFRVSFLLFSLLMFFCLYLTIWVVGFVSIIDSFIADGKVRTLLVMHLAVPYSVRAIWMGACEFNIVEPIK
jgi:hypothetical protein